VTGGKNNSLTFLARQLLLPGAVWCAFACVARSESLQWHRLPDLPDPLGVAGPFVGVHEDALIVAGGANFPQGVPWRPTASGAKSLKTYHNCAHVLTASDKRSLESSKWITANERLAESIAYGVSVDTEQGVLCIGGEWQKHTTDEHGMQTSVLHRSNNVFLLQWKRQTESLARATTWSFGDREYTLPTLPRSVSSACGAKVGNAVYLAGGDCGEGGSGQFLRLDLGAPKENWQWEELPTWPGPPRSHAVGLTVSGKFLLLSGRNKHPEQGIEILTDAYCFDPDLASVDSRSKGWKRLADVGLDDESPTCVMGATAMAIAGGKLLLFGGDSGVEFVEREQTLPRRLQQASAKGDDELAATLKAEMETQLDTHKGFNRRVLAYDLARNAWRDAGELPFPTPVTTTAARWHDRIVLPPGETRPGIRTNQVWALGSRPAQKHMN
jgi:SSS family solute:Na+ symporter